MARLAVQLLGSFRVMLDGEPVTTFESDKVRALLAYLAVEAALPPEVVAAARLRGRARDLDATIAELIAEFEDVPAGPLNH